MFSKQNPCKFYLGVAKKNLIGKRDLKNDTDSINGSVDLFDLLQSCE